MTVEQLMTKLSELVSQSLIQKDYEVAVSVNGCISESDDEVFIDSERKRIILGE